MKIDLISLLLATIFILSDLKSQEIPDYVYVHILDEAKNSGLSLPDYQDLLITHSHMSNVSYIKHYYLNQRYKGISIHQSVMSVHLKQDHTLLKINNQLFRNIEKRIDNSQVNIDQRGAINRVLSHFEYDTRLSKEPIKYEGGENQKVIFEDPKVSLEHIPVYLVYQLTPNGNLRLCWELNILPPDQSAWWYVRVDVETGELLDIENWMISCNFGEAHSHNGSCSLKFFEEKNANITQSAIVISEMSTTVVSPEDGSSYRVFPLGVESPAHGQRILVTNPADSLASPYGWHDTNGQPGAEYTFSRGNNVLAQEDRDGNNNTPGERAEGGPDLQFDFPLNLNLHPHQNQDACITNLFYWNNIIHDIIYHYGFTEAAGNFQENNYGRGGLQNDYVLADAMDGSGTNNANFSTPVDGNRPRMQMFLWSAVNNLTFTVNTPPNIQGNYTAVKANFGPVVYNLTEQLVLVDDGTSAPTLGCSPLINGNELAGKIALIDRGNCEFGTKCLNAQNAGAIAAIVCNNVAGAPIAMNPGGSGSQVTIPSVMVARATCDSIKLYLPNVVVTLLGSGGVPFDSDYDNGIIVHEYGHGISTRLTGGAGTSSCLNNQEQMGEGWSDWYGLMLTMKEGDTAEMGRGIGTYVLGQAPTVPGIRPHRYSTDMTVNPHTYANITTVSVPHGVGSVWCAMLWEMTWALIENYGFDSDLIHGTGGNNIAMKLVTEALKLQPCSPGFVDGRDAILLADQVLYDGAHQCLIWKAFAKRGLGYSADQGSTNSRSDGTEAFDLPPSCRLSIQKMVDKPFASPGDTVHYQFTLINLNSEVLQNVRLSDTLSWNTSYLDGSASDGGVFINGIVEFPQFDISVADTIYRSFSVVVNADLSENPYTWTDGAEIIDRRWQRTSTNAAQSVWSRSNTNPRTGGFSWFAPNVPTNANVFLTLDTMILAGARTQMRFWHNYNLELNWDGGMVQVSTDQGRTWTDLGNLMTENGYNSFINNNPNTPAFSGNSNGYVRTTIDLSSFEGKFLKIRFYLYNDVTIANVGWRVDDIDFINVMPMVHNAAQVIATPDINFEFRLEDPIPIVPCTLVFCNADNGKGTLRRAVECAISGDSIKFLYPVFENIIQLTSPILLNKDLIISHEIQERIFIGMSELLSPIFEVLSDKTIVLDNLSLLPAAASDTRAIINHGNLVIYNLEIIDSNVNEVNGRSVENNGDIQIIGNFNIRKD